MYICRSSSSFKALSTRAQHSISTSQVCSATALPPSNARENLFPTSAYVHLPFCRHRCYYCDFPIVALGELGDEKKKSHTMSTMEKYVHFLCREIGASSCLCYGVLAAPLKTVFLGGGTPSLIPPHLLHEVISRLRATYGFSIDVELSLEMDPGTFDGQYLREIVSYGVNRVSLGVQSFDEKLLKACGRAHGTKEVYEAIELMHTIGIQNWSLDLISSLPNQTLEVWQHSLSEAIAAAPTHISVYDLQIEDGTKFGKMYKAGEAPLPNDEASAELYKTASHTLQEAGYDHYEISNYAKKGYQCRHNLVYWHNQSYYGFGLGSTSYVQLQRFSRPRKLKEYAKFVADLEFTNGEIKWKRDLQQERTLDTVMLALRLAEGIQLKEFTKKFGSVTMMKLWKGVKEFVESGHAMVLNASKEPLCMENISDEMMITVDAAPTYLRLSDPQGFMLSSEIISSLFLALK